MDIQVHADDIPVPSAAAEDKPPEAATGATPVSSLLREIARAMQTAAKRERDRIDAGMGVEETAQVEKIQARAAEEATALRTGADDDVAGVNAWYEDEIRRIREEADRRIADRRRRLELSVAQHGSLIAAETESVHRAIQDYRASLGDFFGRLADEQDPSAIARLAGTLPEQPDIDAARADARSRAMQAIEAGAATAPPAPNDGAPRSGGGGGGGPVPIDELVPVMDPAAVEGGADAVSSGAPVLQEAPAAALPISLPPARTWWLGRSAR
jgi:hypothetical protein